MKKRITLMAFLAVISGILLAGCGCSKKSEATKEAQESEETEKEGSGKANEEKAEIPEISPAPERIIGILMPSDQLDSRWAVDADVFISTLEEKGYKADVRFAGNDPSLQKQQLISVLEEKPEAIIVTPVDVYGLSEEMKSVSDAGLPVFSYDRLVMNTDALSYYITFDTRAAGQAAGKEILERTGSDKDTDKSTDKDTDVSQKYAEFIAGPDHSGEALFFFNGIMETLNPSLQDDRLVCRSGNTAFSDALIPGTTARTIDRRMRMIMDTYDPDLPDVICTSSDSYAVAAAEYLEDQGIEPGGEDWPLITGVGCNLDAVRMIIDGRIGFSIFMDNRRLAKLCADTVTSYLEGDDPDVSDYSQYDNGIKIVRTITYDSEIISKDNYQMLVDDGYYHAFEIIGDHSATQDEQTEEQQLQKTEEQAVNDSALSEGTKEEPLKENEASSESSGAKDIKTQAEAGVKGSSESSETEEKEAQAEAEGKGSSESSGSEEKEGQAEAEGKGSSESSGSEEKEGQIKAEEKGSGKSSESETVETLSKTDGEKTEQKSDLKKDPDRINAAGSVPAAESKNTGLLTEEGALGIEPSKAPETGLGMEISGKPGAGLALELAGD